MSSPAPAPSPSPASEDGAPARDAEPVGGHGAWSPLVLVGVAAVVVVGVVLRFVSRSDLWLDEALSANIAALPIGELFAALRRDGHPPLYYLLLHGWIGVAGDSDVAVRLLSGVISVVALPVAWAAGRRYAGAFGGIVALVLLAVNPFAVRYATEARMYSLVILGVVVGWLAVRRAVERPSLSRLAAVSVVGGLLLLTHYWTFYLLGTVGALALWRAVRPRHEGDRRVGIRLAASLVASVVVFLPWLPSFLAQLTSTGTPWGAPMRPGVIVTEILRHYGGTVAGESDLIGFVFALLAALAVFGRRRGSGRIELDPHPRRETWPEALAVVGTLTVATVAGYLSGSAFATRYSAVIFPIFLLLVTFGISILPRRAGGLVVALLAVAGLGGSVLSVATQRTQSGEVAATIEAGFSPGDVVVYCPDQLGPSVSRHLPGEMRGRTYPAGGDPRFVDWVDYTEKLAASDPRAFAAELSADTPADASIWFVWFGGYRTHPGTCEEIIDRLARERDPHPVLTADAEVFEPSSLVRFGPRDR